MEMYSASESKHALQRQLPQPFNTRARWLLPVWGALVVAGLLALGVHSHQAGEAAKTSVIAKLQTPNPSGRSLLRVFIHPKCPCSVATLEMLTHLMQLCPGKLDATIFVNQTRDTSAHWVQTGALSDLQAMPGVSIIGDEDGQIARKFGVVTSGEVLLFDSEGKILFHGGITPSRGTVGDNPGLQAALARVDGRNRASFAAETAPTFGCALYSQGLIEGGKQ
jgi:hypothetical protein